MNMNCKICNTHQFEYFALEPYLNQRYKCQTCGIEVVLTQGTDCGCTSFNKMGRLFTCIEWSNKIINQIIN